MIKCHFNDHGEIIGFDIRYKIIKLMFMNNDFYHKIL